MQVAVARVEDVADPEAVLALQLGDPPQHLRQLRARHDAVLDVVVGRDPAHRRERRLAALPEQRPLGVVGRHAHLEGAGLAADPLHRAHVVGDLDGDAVELDDQHRRRARRVAGVDCRLGGLNRQLVHHLDRGGEDPGGDHARDGSARGVRRVEAGEQRLHDLRRAQDSQRHADGDAERPLRADDRTEQVVPLLVAAPCRRA